MPAKSVIRRLIRSAFLSLPLVSWCTTCATSQETPEEDRPNFKRAALIEFTGPIGPIREAYFNRKLEKAKSEGADLVIVEIDSPGGYIDSSLSLADTLERIDWAHTVAYVPREALSGAAIMALGSDEIVMADDASIGDAGPIFLGDDALFRHAPEKIRSDLVRNVRDLAESSGRPPAVAEAMVDMDLVVYRVRHRETGEQWFMSDPELESAADGDQWEKGKPIHESREGLFLEVNGQTAVEIKLAEGIADSRNALRARFGLAPDQLVIMETNWVDTTIMVLNHPFVTGLMFVVGLIALYVEFSAPGTGLGGLIAGLCFALFFWSRFLGGTSGWLEVILFVSGLVCLLAEIYLIPGFGFAGLTGLLLLLTSVIMAGQDFVIPQSGLQMRTLTNSVLVTGASSIIFLTAAIGLTKYMGTLPLLNRLTLDTPQPIARSEESEAEVTLQGVKVGDQGVAESTLRPAGKAIFGDHYVDVVADGAFIEKGTTVKVVQVSGNRVVVREG